jgi:hypothetical protein
MGSTKLTWIAFFNTIALPPQYFSLKITTFLPKTTHFSRFFPIFTQLTKSYTMMRYILILLYLLHLSSNAFGQKQISTAKPWAYWWWLGSAVNERDITANLEDFSKAGFGGLHIIPIYGVKGEEANFIPFLGEKWVNMLDYTVKEGQRLGLGIDMTLGTGWPLGGSHVAPEDAAQAFKISKNTVTSKGAYADNADSQGSYATPPANYQLTFAQTKQKVKRAAPGGEGWVLDHFNAAALQRYIKPFDSLFSAKNIGVRAIYNDSYEAYGANWTATFFDRFKILRGYDLSQHLDVLAKDTAITEREKRIWADYNETLSDIMLEDFTKPLTAFAHKHKKDLRNEAHGSPANILDLYAASDMPESEFFGSKQYKIPYYKQDEDYDPRRFGKPGEIVLKLASSAAHIAGKKYVTSETATWLGNHFKVSLKQVKPIIDESFIGGINHIFFHGIPYSPKNAPFPGWLFYASTNFNQQSHFWEHLPQLNGYIERCQNLLQNSKPDNDILLYFPLVDTWHSVGKKDKTHALDVHSLLRDGFLNKTFGDIVFELQNKGYAFDFVSDSQLQDPFGVYQILYGKTVCRYKAIIVPPIDYIPIETLKALEKLKEIGTKVIFINKLPTSVNGYFEVEKRQLEFDNIVKNFTPSVFRTLSQAFDNHSIRRESITDLGLNYIRKTTDKSTLYFISNFDTLFESGKITLQSSGEIVRFYNPLLETELYVSFKKIGQNQIEIPLILASGESVFVEILKEKPASKVQISEIRNPIFDVILRGSWQIDFLSGNPAIPKNYTTSTLSSWTNAADTMAQYFSGKARYTLRFDIDKKQAGKTGYIDLGDVRESAEVKLNGKSLGIAWSFPMRVPIPKGVLKKKDNILEIEVINLSANRMRYVDKRKENWKKFYDINMVDIRYTPFDAANWLPLPSGLLSPVRLLCDKK